MWGIIPAAGSGTRIQPLAFSKELLPVGSRLDESGVERPRAVSEYLIERMVRAGADKICFVISPWKSDILQYYGGAVGGVDVVYVCQAGAVGLCDAIFRALPVVPATEPVIVGLPDTIWFPADALARLPIGRALIWTRIPSQFESRESRHIRTSMEGRGVDILKNALLERNAFRSIHITGKVPRQSNPKDKGVANIADITAEVIQRLERLSEGA